MAWGSNAYGQIDVPDSGPYTMVAGGNAHTVALRADGSVVAWGKNDYGQCVVPEPNSGYIAVSAGHEHSMGLKSDGTIVAWGSNYYGQCDVPAGSSFIAIAGGGSHSLALKSDGTIVAWGSNSHGQCDVPEPNSGFEAVAGGMQFSLGLRSDGSVDGWGANMDGQCNVPEPNSGFVAISGGSYHGIGLKEVTTSVEGAITAELEPGILAIRSVSPNPVTGSFASITYEAPASATLTLEVLDVAGRLVGMRELSATPPGQHTYAWDGCDLHGSELASGAYFLMLRSGNQLAVEKVVLVR